MSPGTMLLLVLATRFCLDQMLYRGGDGVSLSGRSSSSLSLEMYTISSAGNDVSNLVLDAAVEFQAGSFRVTGGLCTHKTAAPGMNVAVDITVGASVGTLAGA